MKPLIALSLGLLLGQTPGITPSVPPSAETQDPAAIAFRDAWERALNNTDATVSVQEPTESTDLNDVGIGGSGTQTATSDSTQAPQASQVTASSGSQGSATSTNPRQEVQQLRAQVQALQSQLAAQQEQSSTNEQALQQRLTGIQERSAELERSRQQRLAELDRARTWMVAADQALEVGELAIGNALGEADTALAQVLDSANRSGNGQTVVLIEDARSLIAQALESTGHRDTLQARQFLFGADWRVREARRQNLDAPSATVVTQ